MIKQRLNRLVAELGITQRQFAKSIEIDPGYCSRILNEDNDYEPSERILLLVESVHNVNKAWLRSGKGEMFADKASTAEKRRVLELVDQLDEEQSKAVLAFLRYLQEG